MAQAQNIAAVKALISLVLDFAGNDEVLVCQNIMEELAAVLGTQSTQPQEASDNLPVS